MFGTLSHKMFQPLEKEKSRVGNPARLFGVEATDNLVVGAFDFAFFATFFDHFFGD